MKIFVSSTREDLQEERDKLISFIDRIPDCEAIAMEKFSASKHRPKDLCINELKKSDALILILGFKYGSVDVEEGISFTEIEYNVAKELGKLNMPIFVFQKRKNGKWKPDEESNNKKQKLIQFKARLDNETSRVTFETINKLLEEVALTLINERNDLELLKSRLNLLVSYEEFFEPFLKKENYFNHTYSFVGRKDYIKYLNDFVLSDKKIAIIHGRGGIGKSRVLLEFSRDFNGKKSEWDIKFLEHVAISNETLPKIPSKKNIIVIDDAHKYKKNEIFPLLKILQKFPDYKLILTSRPYGLNYLKTTLNRIGFDPNEIEILPEIKKVDTDDLEKLAFEILGEEYRDSIKSLVRVAEDSPLVIVVGGKLIKAKKIVPPLFELQQEFHDVVFKRFEEELIGQINDEINNKLYKEILSLISALAPINLGDNSFYTIASEFLKVKTYELIHMIDLLETSGVLLQREDIVKITPDVLSDHVLHNACLTTRGKSTGYDHSVFKAFWDYSPQNLLLNLSELDWRIKQVSESNNLLSEIWATIEHDFSVASNSRRYKILGYIERVAFFQPAKSLRIVEMAINDPNEEVNEEANSYSQTTHNTILYRLPSILDNISYNPEYLTRCCEILWELGKNDIRQMNSYPSHPMKVLSNLAKYDKDKYLSTNSTVLDFVENCFKDHMNHEFYNSLFDIIDELLAKEGTSEEFSVHQITFYPFSVSYENTKFIRERALVLLSESVKIDTTKTKLRVFKSLHGVLWPPTGYHDRKVSEKELNQWIPEIVEVLRIIENLVKTTKDPIVLIQADSDLRRVSRALKKEQSEIVNYIITSILDSWDLQITRALWDEYNKYDRDGDLDYFEMLEKIENIKIQLASELLKKCKNIRRLIDYLENKLDDLQESGVQYHPEGFFVALSITDYKVAQEICQYIISDPGSILSPYFSELMFGIRSEDKEKTIELSLLALETNDKKIIYSLAQGYARKSWSSSFDEDDIEIIKKLINHPDEDIKNLAIRSLGIFPNKWHQLAIQVALKVDIGDNQELANSLCYIFEKNLIKIEEIRYSDIISILDKLVPIKDIQHGSYYVQGFITDCSFKYPHLIINFLFDRILYSKVKERGLFDRYEPLPRDLRFELEIKQHPNYVGILRKVRNKILDPDYNTYYISQLFTEISDDYCPVSLSVLGEWVNSKNIKEIEAIGALILATIRQIRRQPSDFIFSNRDIVSQLLDNLYALDKDSYVKFRDELIDAHFRLRMFSNSSSEESEDDIIVKQSKKILEKLLVESPTREFYYLLCKKAKKNINNQVFDEDEFE